MEDAINTVPTVKPYEDEIQAIKQAEIDIANDDVTDLANVQFDK